MEELQIDSITSFGAGALAGSSKGHFELIGVDVRWITKPEKRLSLFPMFRFGFGKPNTKR